jgi:two-component sensor histidine kinase
MLGNQKRLLLIEDDAGMAHLLQKDLGRDGYRVSVAADGGTGLRRIAEGGIDAVVLDHHLPDQDGLSVLAAIQELSKELPIIYLTASQKASVAVAALKAGAADYVIKDVQGEFLTLLLHALNIAFESAVLRRAKAAAEAEVRAARDRFKALADERALLLREVNHRVSNSLALVAQLLYLQGRHSGPVARADLLAAVDRVQAVARLHRCLYTSDNVQSVALDQYLAALIDDLRASVQEEASALSLNADPMMVEPDRAVAIGVLVTELVLNAKKHAYPTGHGPIRVLLRASKGHRAVLRVEDEGVGYSHGASHGKGLGTMIVQSMSAKLGSQLVYDRSRKGTRAVVKFELGSPLQRADRAKHARVEE